MMSSVTISERVVTSDEVADRISADIQSGSLTPGQWLKQVDIEQRYNVTRNAARAALTKLALQRFVDYTPNRGYRVPAMDARKRTELLGIRAVLEASMVPGIITSITHEAIEELRALADDFMDLLSGGEFLKLIEINAAFHNRMYLLCGNDELLRMVRELRQSLRPFPGMMWTSRDRMRLSGLEHLAMVAALERRDTEALMRLIAEHIGKGEIGSIAMVRLIPSRTE